MLVDVGECICALFRNVSANVYACLQSYTIVKCYWCIYLSSDNETKVSWECNWTMFPHYLFQETQHDRDANYKHITALQYYKVYTIHITNSSW